MPSPRPTPHDVRNEQAIKELFPEEAREAVVLEPKASQRPAGTARPA